MIPFVLYFCLTTYLKRLLVRSALLQLFFRCRSPTPVVALTIDCFTTVSRADASFTVLRMELFILTIVAPSGHPPHPDPGISFFFFFFSIQCCILNPRISFHNHEETQFRWYSSHAVHLSFSLLYFGAVFFYGNPFILS